MRRTAPECTHAEEDAAARRTSRRLPTSRYASRSPATPSAPTDREPGARRPSPTSPTTPGVGPGALFVCVPGQRRTDTTSRAPRWSAARRRSSSSGRWRSPWRSSSSPTRGWPWRLPPMRSSAGRRASSRWPASPGRTARRRRPSSSTPILAAAAGRRPGSSGRSRCASAASGAGLATTPEAIDLQRIFRELLDAGDRSCAMEASSHASELRRLVGTRFRALGLHQPHPGSPRLPRHAGGLLRGQARLFTEPDVDGNRPPAAVNVGDAHGRGSRTSCAHGGERLTFGLVDDADIRARRAGARRRRRRACVPTGSSSASPARRFNVENVLGAVAPHACSGSTTRPIVRGVEHVAGVPGRFEAVDEGQPFAVLVDYAHTPEALENVLAEARRRRPADLICVFGCGGDRDRAKRPLMGAVVSRLADRAIVTSDNPRARTAGAIIGRSCRAWTDEEVEPDRAAAIAHAIEECRGRRRRRHRRQGSRAGPGAPRQDDPLRRPRGRARGPARGWARRHDPARARRGRGARPGPGCGAAPGAEQVTGVTIDSRSTKAGRALRRRGRRRRLRRGRARRRAGGRARPEDASARSERWGSGSRRVPGQGGRRHRVDREDVDEGHPRRALRAARATVAAEGSQNNEIGLPLTLCCLEEDTEVAVVEMGMRGLGQIAEPARSPSPTSASSRASGRCTSSSWARSSASPRPRPS